MKTPTMSCGKSAVLLNYHVADTCIKEDEVEDNEQQTKENIHGSVQWPGEEVGDGLLSFVVVLDSQLKPG